MVKSCSASCTLHDLSQLAIGSLSYLSRKHFNVTSETVRPLYLFILLWLFSLSLNFSCESLTFSCRETVDTHTSLKYLPNSWPALFWQFILLSLPNLPYPFSILIREHFSWMGNLNWKHAWIVPSGSVSSLLWRCLCELLSAILRTPTG